VREAREVFFIDGVRTAFGKAGPKGQFWRTRADDMGVKAVRELLRRNPEIPPERIGDVVLAATAQVGDQGLTLGRDVALLAGIPQTVPGFALDRMCAGALTAVTAGAGEIALGAADVVLAGGVEHMGHHPMAEEVDFNPRFVAERLVDPSAVTMGATAENLHDRFPQITKGEADAFAVRSQQRAAAAWQNGVMRDTVVPMAVFTDDGWREADVDEFLRPDTSLDALAQLRTPFRPGGRVTAGNSAGLTDGATACFLAAEDTAMELGVEPKMRLVAFAFAGVEPALMGIGPIPATKRVLEQAGLTLDDVGLFELDELERRDFAAAVFTGKPFFFAAGADITEFPGITAERAREGSRAGHELFRRLSVLPFPTVAAIDGACLGGGVELALHCTARTISSAVRHFAFPEVFLGLFPAWGGTQLLPRLVGPETAIKVIVANPLRQNRMLRASEVAELGIADAIHTPAEFLDASLAFARALT